jgi:predicted kinase
MYKRGVLRNYQLATQPSLFGIFSLVAVFFAVVFLPSKHQIMASAKISVDTSYHHQTQLWMEASLLARPSVTFRPRAHYNWGLSTEKNYRTNDREFCGRFEKIRQRLDYEYHTNYTCSRQRVQDIIIGSMLKSTKLVDKDTGRQCSAPTRPWIVFTAGVMGAGKTHTIRQLDAKGQFPLESFVSVDPDEIRRLLPEFQSYVDTCPELAGELTRKEAGMMAEILTEAALERGQNVLVDGSLWDAAWYQKYFTTLRQSHPSIKLGIIHVTAPTEAIFQRVKVRILFACYLHFRVVQDHPSHFPFSHLS